MCSLIKAKEKATISAKDYGSNKYLGNESTMNDDITKQNVFQYHCSFCACELLSNSVRFNGVGACPACNDLAHLWVDSLREYEANYKNNLGVRK